MCCNAHLMKQGPVRGEDKPEEIQSCSHWWKVQPSGLLHLHTISSLFIPFFFPLISFHTLFSLLIPFQFFHICLLLPLSISLYCMQNSVAPHVPLFQSVIILLPLSQVSLHVSPQLSILTHSLYCHTVYLSQTLLQRLSALGIGTFSTADFHSSCLIRESFYIW